MSEQPPAPAPRNRKLPEIVREFQPDAIEVESRTPPLLARGTLYALAAFLIIGFLWAALSSVDVMVIAQGRLTTSAQSRVIQALETSVVRSIDVKVGQAVKSGEIVATLDPTFSDAEVAQAKRRLLSLAAEIARIQAELDGKPYVRSGSAEDDALQSDLFERRTSEYRARLSGYRADLARYEADLRGTQEARKVLAERLEYVRTIEKMKTEMSKKGVLSTVEALDASNQRAEVEQQAGDAASKESQLKQQIEQSRSTLDAFTKSWRQKLLDEMLKAQRERDPLVEQLSKSERRKALVHLTAPFDAVVLDINRRSVGSVAREADPIVTLVPQGVPIEAELQIASEDIGFVRINDLVRLKIDAFPFQKHGVVTAKLTVVGEDSFTADSNNSGSQPKPSTRAYYTGRATDLKSDLKKVPKDTRLAPGMTLTAEIKVSERSVISYFMYPLIKAFDESIREP